jgi:hypothetical protein
MGLLIDPHLRTVNYDPITSFEPKRRRLMEAWASYRGLAARKADTVVPLRAAVGGCASV